jgi:hypothetical protein
MKLILIAFLLAFGAAVIFVMFTANWIATSGSLFEVFAAIAIERWVGL